jgi:hypothetical protein
MSKRIRLTLGQCKREIDDALALFEEIALETLHKEFGFGPKRQERFMNRFHTVARAKLMEQYAQMNIKYRHML